MCHRPGARAGRSIGGPARSRHRRRGRYVEGQHRHPPHRVRHRTGLPRVGPGVLRARAPGRLRRRRRHRPGADGCSAGGLGRRAGGRSAGSPGQGGGQRVRGRRAGGRGGGASPRAPSRARRPRWPVGAGRVGHRPVVGDAGLRHRGRRGRSPPGAVGAGRIGGHGQRRSRGVRSGWGGPGPVAGERRRPRRGPHRRPARPPRLHGHTPDADSSWSSTSWPDGW